MWVFLNNAFVSVVAQRGPSRAGKAPRITPKLLVRARFEGDIERALGVAVKVSVTPAGDYLYRAVVTRRAFKAALRSAVDSIDYDNFKGSIAKPDFVRHEAYLGVWGEMLRAQRRSNPPRDLEFGLDPWDRLNAARPSLSDYRFRPQRELSLYDGSNPFGTCPDCGCDLDRLGFCSTCGFDAADLSAIDDDDEGCPVGDPGCFSRAGECHDACESPVPTSGE